MSDNFQSFQHGAAEAEFQPVHTYNPARIIDGAHSVSSRDGVITEEHKVDEKARSNEASPFHGTEGIFGTAKNANGTPAMAISDDTLLEYQGVQAAAKTLAMAGVIKQYPDGSYSELDQQVAPAEETGESQADISIHPDDMAQIHEAVAGLDEGTVHGVLSIGIGVASGRLDASALEAKWSRATGQRGEDSKLARMQTIFQHQADYAVTSKGGVGAADLDSFYSWAKQHHREQLADAIQKQVHTANSAGYVALAQKFLASTPPSVEALKAAGVPTRKSAHGATGAGSGVEVFVRGSWMSVGAAAKAGLL